MIARDQGLDVVAVARARQRAAHLADLAPRGRDLEAPRPRRRRRSPPPGSRTRPPFSSRSSSAAALSLDDVEEVNVGLNLLPALLSNRADAMLGGFKNIEGVDLAERGEDPSVVPVDELGIPTYDELVLVASEDLVEDDPEEIRLFLDALARGTRDAAPRPRRGHRDAARRRPRPRPEADRGRGRGHAAAARGPARRPLRLHEHRPVAAVRRLHGRRGPDRRPPRARRDAHQRAPAARAAASRQRATPRAAAAGPGRPGSGSPESMKVPARPLKGL